MPARPASPRPLARRLLGAGRGAWAAAALVALARPAGGQTPPSPAPAASGPSPSPGPARAAPALAPPGPKGEAGGGAAGPAPALLWPTLTPAGDEPAGEPLRIPSEKDGALAERARDLDALLVDTAQDLGLTVDLGRRPYDKPRATRDLDLLDEAGAARAWVISPRIEREGGEYLLRLVAVPPGGRALRVRVERVKGPGLLVRAAVMLRDLVGASPTSGALGGEPGRAPSPEPPGDVATRARSGGRAVLAASGAAFGGFTGFALQRASRNDDPRLLYPLVALGTGVGLGAALIAADEWDVRPGEAWYLAAGTWWPVASALFLTAGYGLEPESDRYAVALLSGLGGTGLASLVLSQRRVGEGDALLVHSGGLLGTVLGGGAQWLVEGSTKVRPYRGLGYGAAAGVLAAGLLATQVRVSPARMLLVDLGAGLGSLAGAAAGSPLLFATPSKSEERAWVALTLGGTLAGATAAVWLTRSMAERSAFAPPRWLPLPAAVGAAPDGGPKRPPALGLSWQGTW